MFVGCLGRGLAGLGRIQWRAERNPISDITKETGTWTLRFLMATLAVTPATLTGWNDAIRFRRMLGLFAFFTARFISRPTSGSISSSTLRPS